MSPTGGRTGHDHRRARTGTRGRPPAVLTTLVAVCGLTLGLTACGGTAVGGGAVRSAGAVSWTDGRTGAQAGARAVERQADALRQQCTVRPEDRAACTMPEGARITPGGGDLDGDGVFEPHEPVGPGHRDPRAYAGGPTSGETQCAWARQQGYGC